jgi:hypothetical protein
MYQIVAVSPRPEFAPANKKLIFDPVFAAFPGKTTFLISTQTQCPLQ